MPDVLPGVIVARVLLPEVLSLHDVLDVEAFVHATMNRSRILFAVDEREELVSEGIAISVKLARDYRPRMGDHLQDGRFSGYLAQFLPRKLGDAWHRMHPEHQLRTGLDGKRRWHLGERNVSLQALTADDPDRHELLSAGRPEGDMRPRVRRALDERWERKREMILDVADVLGAGGTDADAAAMLGLTRAQVMEAVGEIMLVADSLRSDSE